MKQKKFLVADLLCGAGGSSTGCARALGELGLEMDLVCVNHWPTAIETHQKNHPEARHYVQDIGSVRPHLLVPEGYLDLLMASPTCTHHSVARGGKPTSDQQRSDPWHIITWFTELRVKRAIIENVWEFTGWGPVNWQTGKPVKSRKGEYFRAWVEAIRACGATSIEWKKLNAADFGDATTRSRFIMMIRFDGKKIAWPRPTHQRRSPTGDLALFPGMKHWRPAREIIDWEIKGKSIFDRKKPLAPKTLARIYAGAEKFNWPEPFLVILRQHMGAQSVDDPLPTLSAGGTHVGLAQPMIIANRNNNAARDPSESPAPCFTTAPGGGIALIEPFVLATGSTGAPRETSDPLPTITTGGAGSDDQGCARPMLVEPFIVGCAHGNQARESNPDQRRVKSLNDPLGAIHAGGGNFAIAAPFIFSRHGEGAPRSLEEPTPTQVAKHSHVLISPYYGSGSGETCTSADDDPLPTLTGKNRFGMVVPVTNGSGGPGPRSAEEPLPTMTTAKGGEFALVMPVTHHDASDRVRDPNEEPLPTITGAQRGELAFIAAQFGERQGQAPRVHDIEDPMPTLCAEGRVQLVEATPHYDILFRMLEPHELASAMGFNDDEQRYEFAGTKTEQIKQIGNAVSVAKMKACVKAMMADAVKTPRASSAPSIEKTEAA